MSPQKVLYRGEGRGAITNDGCAVELYRLLPYRGELAIFDRLLARRSAILDLGCAASSRERLEGSARSLSPSNEWHATASS